MECISIIYIYICLCYIHIDLAWPSTHAGAYAVISVEPAAKMGSLKFGGKLRVENGALQGWKINDEVLKANSLAIYLGS